MAKVFTILVLDQQCRIDGGIGDIMIISPYDTQRNSIAIPGASQLIYMANAVATYDVDANSYIFFKDRNGGRVGRGESKIPLSKVFFGQEVFLIADWITQGTKLSIIVNSNLRNPDTKMIKISLAGLDQPELYLSSLYM